MNLKTTAFSWELIPKVQYPTGCMYTIFIFIDLYGITLNFSIVFRNSPCDVSKLDCPQFSCMGCQWRKLSNHRQQQTRACRFSSFKNSCQFFHFVMYKFYLWFLHVMFTWFQLAPIFLLGLSNHKQQQTRVCRFSSFEKCCQYFQLVWQISRSVFWNLVVLKWKEFFLP